MAFQQGSATDLDDLFNDLATFLTGALGWTLNGTVGSTGFGFSKGNIFVQFRYDGSSPPAEGRTLAIYQSLGYDSSAPGGNPDDSGSGHFQASGTPADSTLDNSRHISNVGDGPFPNYWFFADTSPDYVHIVLEVRTDEFRHFGFGLLDKFGDNWTGGEYVYGHKQSSSNPTSPVDYVLIDALANLATGVNANADDVATVHVESLPGQDPTSKWGISWSNLVASPGTDRAGNPRVLTIGGARGGFIAGPQGGFGGSAATGLIPLVPMGVFYVEPQTGLRAMFLGWMKDVRLANMRDIQPRDEINIGGDDWIFFPTSIRTLQTVSPPLRSSFVAGIAYKKIP